METQELLAGIRLDAAVAAWRIWRWHIAKTVIQILRERLVELKTLKATGAAPEDTVRRLAFVGKLLVPFDATASRAFSREVDTGSRQENAMKQKTRAAF